MMHLPELHHEMRKWLRHFFEVNARRYDLRKRDLALNVGDRVWKRNFVLSDASRNFTANFSTKYVPCIVSKVVSSIVYSLKDLNGRVLGNFHIKDIKLDLSSDDNVDSLKNNSYHYFRHNMITELFFRFLLISFHI